MVFSMDAKAKQLLKALNDYNPVYEQAYTVEHVCCDLYHLCHNGNRVYGSLLRYLRALGVDVVNIEFINGQVKILMIL